MHYLNITHFLNGILCIGLGIGLGIYLTHHAKGGWRIWWIGALTFIFSQVIHIPFNLLILNPQITELVDSIPEIWYIPTASIMLGLSAGLFEEFSRYIVYRAVIKDARSWSLGILFGAGHGGFEAILIGGLSLYTYIQMLALKGMELSTIIPPEQISIAQQQISIYWSVPWYDSLLGALERALAIPLHLAGAILVLQAFTRKQFRWVWYAVGLHALVDALAVYLARSVNIYAAEAAIGFFALLEIGLILLLRRSPNIASIPLPENKLSLPPVIVIREVTETTEKLEETRYQ